MEMNLGDEGITKGLHCNQDVEGVNCIQGDVEIEVPK